MYSVLFRGKDFIVVNKESMIDFHSNDETKGLFQTIKSDLSLKELYPVHRLDKITSGILIVALTKNGEQELSTLFRTRKIDKYYIALSDKKPRKKQGTVKGDMIRSRRSSWKLVRTVESPAITKFKYLKELSKDYYFLLIKPLTGKTHQIRVALNSIGAPILGDPIYNGLSMKKHISRGYLHAYAIKFSLNNKEYFFKALPSTDTLFTGEYTQIIDHFLTSPDTILK